MNAGTGLRTMLAQLGFDPHPETLQGRCLSILCGITQLQAAGRLCPAEADRVAADALQRFRLGEPL